MANQEQLSILKQGVEVWNEWREENPDAKIDLSGAYLYKADLRDAMLNNAKLNSTDLTYADMSGSKLKDANLSGAQLYQANLSGADLYQAKLRAAQLGSAILTDAYMSLANLFRANLISADLRRAELSLANLEEADLHEADLREADLTEANLHNANLARSFFSLAKLGGTIIGMIELSETIGLEDVIHIGPSSISTDTFVLSKGKIPEVFLRGCGLSDWEIEEVKLYNPDLSNAEINDIQYKIYALRATRAFQISPLFISYGHTDSLFVDKVETQLKAKGIRFWRDIHEMKAGRIEAQIDRAISQNPTLLLVLSENSIKSDWVEHEVRTARELEKDMGRDVLCPIALDDSWKSSPWPKRVMEQIMEYNILDFSAWEDDVKFEGMFRKLIDGLELFYKDKSHGE